MKKFSLLSVLIAVVLVLLASPAFAGNNGGTVVVPVASQKIVNKTVVRNGLFSNLLTPRATVVATEKTVVVPQRVVQQVQRVQVQKIVQPVRVVERVQVQKVVVPQYQYVAPARLVVPVVPYTAPAPAAPTPPVTVPQASTAPAVEYYTAPVVQRVVTVAQPVAVTARYAYVTQPANLRVQRATALAVTGDCH